ncbi:hypothetical protein U9M48_022479 [Paspalum notatum var. saurae]|uniref:Uncharacterized protein n=1 Tax=Paspalum notatum var. saurae TaxID=547442 RepID=A0AAQ3TL50_PASNO
MVVGFRRTISFPAPRSPTAAPPTSGSAAAAKSAAYRARSASLPCRFHPLVLQLDDDVADLRAAVARLAPRPQEASSAGAAVAEAADQLGRVLASLSDLLHHPQAQDPLRRLARSPLADRLLDDFLRLADAHGCFREALLALAALQAEARAALRRAEPARLASAARALRRSAARELPRVANAARAVAARAPPAPPAGLPADAAAVAAAVVDAALAVAAASAAVFSSVSALSAAAAATARVDADATPCWMPSPARFGTPSATPRWMPSPARFSTPSATPRHTTASSSSSSMPRIWWVADLMRWMCRAKRRSATRQHADSVGAASSAARPDAAVDPEEQERKAAAFERLDSLGRCVADVESSGEKVFRALVNTRVSLLNILSPAAF